MMEAAALGIADPSCYNAFSAGASNAANPVAPLVGSGSITASEGILLAIAAIGLWGFTIARRTLDTVGEGLTDHPILVAMFVSLIGATIITILSDLGVPASLAVSMNLLGPIYSSSTRTSSNSRGTIETDEREMAHQIKQLRRVYPPVGEPAR